jgi:hypothetical protein
MSRIWAAAIAAISTALLSTFVIPAAAWAEGSGVADELRRRPGIFRGFFGVAGLLCCVVVVAGVVVTVILLSRRRR